MNFEDIGNGVMKVLKGIFGSRNERLIRSILPIVDRINSFEPKMQALTDELLKSQTVEFRERLKKGETLDDILPEAFAAVREASRRVTKMRHFDVQLIGGIVLHQGKISEMATGEGKTLVATLPTYLNALAGQGVHIVTVNDYLARRDREWMGPIYEMLGLTVGVIQNQMGSEERRAAYGCDITYGTNNEFGFDYLRDNMRVRLADQVQRKHHYAIVDEVDSILIDEARTPLIISGPAEESTNKYYLAEQVASRLLKGEHYIVKEKDNMAVLTEVGIERAQQLAGVDSFYTGENMEWPHHIEQALRAKELYRKDKEYIVKDGEVLIVDEFTGRLMPGRRWSDGLHQAIEAKEHIKIKEENQTLATITLQNYFKMYNKLAGMTGTAATEAMEFFNIYKLEVVTIPTNKSLIRATYPDMVFRTEQEKFKAIADEIAHIHETGRPILVGTTSIANSERISEMLERRGIKHEVLNAKHHEREAQIIAKAGQHTAVTIATNMAGRGTDIILGQGVAAMGGLHILGTERHEARRIDNQLRGRAGRQGDPGSSQFILALEDTLLRVFAPQWISTVLLKLGMTENQPIESRMVSNAIEKAQKRMEAHNFDIRKNLLEYDKVMSEQRSIVYGQRQNILGGEPPRTGEGKRVDNNLTQDSESGTGVAATDVKTMVKAMMAEIIQSGIDRFLPEGAAHRDWDYPGLAVYLKRKFGKDAPDNIGELIDGKPVDEVEGIAVNEASRLYDEREKRLGVEYMNELARYILLDKIDEKWKNHLYAMDYLRTGIWMRGQAQIDPKIAYKTDGYRMFDEMLTSVKEEVTDLVFKIEPMKDAEEKLAALWKITSESHQEVGSFEGIKKSEAEKAADNTTNQSPQPVRAERQIGRNDPCPCGSGKKYKKCCGVR